MKTFFYIITRDSQIFEIEYTQERFNMSLEQWQKGGLIIFPTLGMALNAVDISKILNADQYNNFIDSSLPKFFIKNGTWYETKNRNTPVRYEPWREKEIESKRQLMIKEENIPNEKISEMIKKHRPEVYKNWVINHET